MFPVFFPNFRLWIPKRCKGLHCADLGESLATSIYLENLASIQPSTSSPRFAEASKRYPPPVINLALASSRTDRSRFAPLESSTLRPRASISSWTFLAMMKSSDIAFDDNPRCISSIALRTGKTIAAGGGSSKLPLAHRSYVHSNFLFLTDIWQIFGKL